MTAYILFAGLGFLIYAGVALAETAIAGSSGGAYVASALQSEGGASIISPNGSRAAQVAGESARALAAGKTLFQERGCVGCHEPDKCGVGPLLHGLFGSPVQDRERGVAIVDESYLREAILNPSATVAEGFAPDMPTFAGQLTEEELQALIVYLKSLSMSVEVRRQ
jgi:cytochrome c oxidase subunit 2